MTKTRTTEEVAVLSKEFLDGVTALAREHNLHRRLVVHLFGLFARYCVESDEMEGMPHDKAMMRCMEDFMQGLGVQTVIQKVAGDQELEAVAAIVEATRGKATLQ